MKNPYLFIAREYSGVHKLVLATVISTQGSTPQKPGSSAIFSDEKLVYGTIGGGVLEGRVTEIARDAALKDISGLYYFDLDKSIDNKDDAICGGRAEVLIDSNPAIYLEVFKKAEELLNESSPCIVISLIGPAPGKTISIERLLFDPGNPDSLPEYLKPFIGRECVKLISGSTRAECTLINFSIPGKSEKLTALLEPFFPASRLVIAGAGHIGKALCRLASRLDFEVTVIDDRNEFANSENLPEANSIIVGNIGNAISGIKIDSNTFIVIVTRGHNDDSEALRSCIGSEAAYIGMIGSKTKIAKMHRNFIDYGWATEDQWSFIKAPVGLEIFSQSVEEIAVSIAAQLILVRNTTK